MRIIFHIGTYMITIIVSDLRAIRILHGGV